MPRMLALQRILVAQEKYGRSSIKPAGLTGTESTQGPSVTGYSVTDDGTAQLMTPYF